MTATFFVGDAIEVMSKLPEKSVDLILTSPPFLALRSYLPADHPDKALEGGSQATPGAFIDWLIDVVEACDRVLAPHGSLCIELGDTYAGSGGAGGDYGEAGNRAGQEPFQGSGYQAVQAKVARVSDESGHPIRSFPPGGFRQGGGTGWPLAKSLSLIPELFRLTLVYGTNPLTGRTTERWRLRNVVRWVRPNPPVGALGDKFRPATSELMVFCKSAKRYFDLDAVREPFKHPALNDHRLVNGPTSGLKGPNLDRVDQGAGNFGSTAAGAPPLDWWNIPISEDEEPTRYGPKEKGPQPPAGDQKARYPGGNPTYGPGRYGTNALGSPPLDWWNIPPGGYEGAHYAVFPPELCIKPIKAMCPERVCRQCGEPSRRIVNTRTGTNRQPVLAEHIKERRINLGFTVDDVNGWVGYVTGVQHWENPTPEFGRIPTPEVWPILKERLGLSADFDDMIYGGDLAEYEAHGVADRQHAEPAAARHGWESSRAQGMGLGRATKITKDAGFTDCGHNDYRPGMVLDPFVGSGTTLMVATGHGRDAIGIDLDARNYDLALERVGPFVLERAG